MLCPYTLGAYGIPKSRAMALFSPHPLTSPHTHLGQWNITSIHRGAGHTSRRSVIVGSLPGHVDGKASTFEALIFTLGSA